MSSLHDIHDASAEVLICRDEGHAWSFVTDSLTEHKGRVIEFVQQRWCTRCGCTRSRHIQVPTMAILKTTYSYPPDFLMAPGSGRVRPKDVRRVVLERVIGARGTAKVDVKQQEATS